MNCHATTAPLQSFVYRRIVRRRPAGAGTGLAGIVRRGDGFAGVAAADHSFPPDQGGRRNAVVDRAGTGRRGADRYSYRVASFRRQTAAYRITVGVSRRSTFHDTARE